MTASEAPVARRVLLAVNSAGLGGAERMALHEARALASRHHLVVAIPDGPLRRDFAELAPVVNGSSTLPLWGAAAKVWLRRLVKQAPDVFELLVVLHRHRIDTIVTNSATLLAPVLAGFVSRRRVIVHVRDWPASKLSYGVLRLLGWLADDVVVIADRMRELPVCAGRARVHLVRDGVDEALLSPAPTRAPSRRHRLCIVGALDPRKGQLLGLAAVRDLVVQGWNLEISLIGADPESAYSRECKRLATQSPMLGRVFFLGQVRRGAAAIAEHDLLVAPSIGEWTPLVLMEAMLQRVPVVANDVGAVREVLDEGRVGELVSLGAKSHLAEALSTALSRVGAEREVRLDAAERWIRERYSLMESIEGLTKLIEQVGDSDVAWARAKTGRRRSRLGRRHGLR